MLSLRNFFFAIFFLQRIFLFPPKNKLSSQRGLQLLPYKASPIRTSTYTTSPLSSPLFALCVRYVVFEEAEGAALRPPFGLTITIAPATYWGVAGVVGVLVPPRWCQNDVQQVFTNYKIGQKIAIPHSTQSDRPTLCFFVFFF
jgi:hypothetical protein